MVVTNTNSGVTGVDNNVTNPVQYPEGFTGADQKNANLNTSAYGDDTNTADYGTVGYGGANTKYSGEGTKNTNTAYNADIKTTDLNPDYKYGGEAIAANSAESGYIMNRNDNIASALYNEGITSVEGVRNFLNQQTGFTNSTPEMQENTTQSIYKRIGEFANQQQEETPVETEEEEKPAFGEENPADNTGVIYGRETGTQVGTGSISHGEETQSDPYGAMQLAYNARKKNYESLQSMDPYNVAVSIVNGYTPYGENALRDLQKYDPERYSKIQEYIKDLNAENTINDIASGTHSSATSYTESVEETINNDIDSRVNQNSTNDEDALQNTDDLINSLSSNSAAQSAYQEMSNISKDIAELNNQLENLPEEAKKAFKGDVPAYLYDCYVSNQSQKIQNELSKLESRYESAADMYKTELSNYQREQEMALKYKQLEMDQEEQERERSYKEKELELSQIQRVEDGNGGISAYKYENGKFVKLTDDTAYQSYQTSVKDAVETANSYVGTTTMQCEVLTDRLANATAGVTMVGANGNVTTIEEKIAYATNENVSDVVPVVGDVAVFDYRGTSSETTANAKYGHTRYVTDVSTDSSGNTWITMVGANETNGETKKVTMTLSDFYNNRYGVGFWNPYKQAQYNNIGSSIDSGTYDSPMSQVIDELLVNADSQGERESLATFKRTYENVYDSIQDGSLEKTLTSGMISTFLNNLSQSYTTSVSKANNQTTTVGGLFSLTVSQLAAEAENYAAEHVGEEEAYDGFLTLLGVIETKLRNESGASINQNERAMDFLQYLPKASDTQQEKVKKVRRLENYIQSLGTECGVVEGKYEPLFTDLINKLSGTDVLNTVQNQLSKATKRSIS